MAKRNFLKRAMELVKYDVDTTAKNYASNIIALKNDAKAVSNAIQTDTSDIIQSAQANYKRIKTGRVFKDLADWFYNNAEEAESEAEKNSKDDDFDPGFDFGEDEDEKSTDKPSLSLPSVAESGKQLSAMYKIGAKQTEASIANTAELVATFNARSAEIITAVNNVNSSLSDIKKSIDNISKLMVNAADKEDEQRTDNMSIVDETGKITLAKLYESIKQNNELTNNAGVSIAKTLIDLFKGGSPEEFFSQGMSLVRDKIKIKDKSLNEWGEAFDEYSGAITQRILRSLLDNDKIKKVIGDNIHTQEANTDYSQYRVNKYNEDRAVFDNMTRQTIVSVIPEYLKNIEKHLSGRQGYLNIDEYGHLTTEAEANRFEAVTAESFKSVSLSQDKLNVIGDKLKDQIANFDRNDLDIAARALTSAYVMSMQSTGAATLMPSQISSNDFETISYAVRMIQYARGGSESYWFSLCQNILFTIENNMVECEKFIQNAAKSAASMRGKGIDVAQSAFGHQAGVFTDQMVFDQFKNSYGAEYNEADSLRTNNSTPSTASQAAQGFIDRTVNTRLNEAVTKVADAVTTKISSIIDNIGGTSTGDKIDNVVTSAVDKGNDVVTKIKTKINEIVNDINNEETGNGDMASYGTYLNMNQRGCGPVALAEYINRIGGNADAAEIAKGMAMMGAYDPNRGTSVGGYINAAKTMGMNLQPGKVTREALLGASPNHPITTLGSGTTYGTRNGNNHFVNVLGGNGSYVYVSNPLTGRVTSESLNDFISSSSLGLYGSGDDDTQSFKWSSLLNLPSTIWSNLTNVTGLAKNLAGKGLDFLQEKATNKFDEIKAKRAYESAQTEFSEENLSSKEDVSDSDKMLIQSIMQTAQIATTNGDVDETEINLIQQNINKIENPEVKRKITNSIMPMLKRVKASTDVNGDGEKKGGIIGKVLSGISKGFKKLFKPIKSLLSTAFKKIASVGKKFITSLFKRTIELFKSGASDLRTGSTALRESLFGVKDADGNRIEDGLMQQFITNPLNWAKGIGVNLATAAKTSISDRIRQSREDGLLGKLSDKIGQMSETFKDAREIFGRREPKAEGEDKEKANSLIDKLKETEIGKGFMSVYNKQEEEKKAAKLKTPETMTDVNSDEMKEMMSGNKDSIFTAIRDIIVEHFNKTDEENKPETGTETSESGATTESTEGEDKKKNENVIETTATENPNNGEQQQTQQTASSLVTGGNTGTTDVNGNASANGGKKNGGALFNIGKMLGGITKILGGLGKMILSIVMGMSGLKMIMSLVENVLKRALKPINKIFKTIYSVIKPIVQKLGKVVNKVASAVTRIATSIIKVIQPLISAIGPVIDALFEGLEPVLEILEKDLMPVLTPILDVVVKVLQPVMKLLGPFITFVSKIFKTWSGMFKIVVGSLKSLVGKFTLNNKLAESGKAQILEGAAEIGEANSTAASGSTTETEDTSVDANEENPVTAMINGSGINDTGYAQLNGSVMDGTAYTGSGDYGSVSEATAGPIVSVIREELIPQLHPIVNILSKWLAPAMVNIDKIINTIGNHIKTIAGAQTMLKGAVMTVVGFFTKGLDEGKLLTAGVNTVKQGFSDAFSGWKSSMSGLVRAIPVVGDIMDVYSSTEGEETPTEQEEIVVEPVDENAEMLEESGSGNMASYGAYLNMCQRGCGPLALSENINRRGGRVSAAALAGGMAGQGTYDPNRGTSVAGYINTARSMGVNLTPGTVTRESLSMASPRNPITVLGSGTSYGTRPGNNHFVNVIGRRGSNVLVSNPLTGRVSPESMSNFIATSKVGLYGSGDLDFDMEDATESIGELSSGWNDFLGMFKPDTKSYATIQKEREDAETAEAANSLLKKNGSSLDDYEEIAYKKFKEDYPQKPWQSDKSYAKKWAKKRNKYLLDAAKDDLATAYQSEYKEQEESSVYDTKGNILSGFLDLAGQLIDGILGKNNGNNNNGSTSGSSATAEKFISLAESDVGKDRSSVNCTSGTGGTSGDWCANYVSQVMKRSGYDGPFNFTVGYLLKAMEESSDWEKVDKKDAARGDVVFFDWENPNPFDGSDETAMKDPQRRWDHVGWILNNNGNNWTCIEGNAGGAQTVTKQTRYDPYVDTIMRFVADRTSSGGELVGNTNKDKIWSYLVAPESAGGMGLSRAGAAGIMGNMQNESGFEPNNLENEANRLFGMSDDEYTAAVNNGSYSKEKFMHDHWRSDLTDNCGSGYGLVQFTWYTLKRDLYDYAMAHSRDISNLTDQLAYLKQSIINDKSRSFLESLQTVSDPYNAATEFMRVYEGCENQGSEGVARGNNARLIFSEYANAAIPSSPFQSTATDLVGPTLPDGLNNVVLNKYDSPIGPKMPSYSEQMTSMQKTLPNTSFGIASSSTNKPAMNTNDEVIFTSDSNGKSFTQSGFGGSPTVGDLYYSMGPWKVASINSSSGKYNLVSTVDSNFAVDDVPRDYITLYRTSKMVSENYKPASLYGSGDILSYNVESLYGSGDISSFYEPIDTPTYQPSYQVINSSYDNMSREQMISSLSKIEFNVSAKRLEALVEQVIVKLDNQQNVSVTPRTKNTNTQSMFTEEIPNQLMKLYT